MASRRLLQLIALVGLVASMGCRAWCDRWYPEHHPGAACCNPCCASPAVGYAPAPTFNAPRTMNGCTCTCP